ncbi:putative porin [Paraburkholderia sp. BL27I4N3]|uniref:porin n=1 Tax=Paraburkholderia sp. BL27I4N3 TaxID=1938805 RepID=UPI000E2300BC|nr:porin [Paraburkholderia sp. BL27I4N3]REE24143.1 putative porin [Paraburkholderia sp. BL27I4N3]
MIKKTIVASCMLGGVCVGAHAQSSVTLYGVADNGLAWQNSATSLGSTSGGHSLVKMTAGVWAGSRFGLKGSEDLGSGTKAIFTLEAGFNSTNGTSQFTGGMFTRQSWVGVTNDRYGTLTAGRQYTAYYNMLAPWSPTTWLTGYFGAHPGDIDSLDNIYRANNSLVYQSPTLGGFTFSASYAFGGVPGSVDAGSTWSAGLRYQNGPFGIGAAAQRVNNSTPGGGAWGASSTTSNGGAQTAVSAINYGYQTAQAQQRVAVTGGYRFSAAWDVSASYSNVQYIPGIGSTFRDTAIFNTAGAVLHFKPASAWDFAAGYSYTRATKANGITSAAQYQQFTLSQYYALSKRTGVYAVQSYQRANGDTLWSNGKVIVAKPSLGDGFSSTPASSRSQIAVGAGLVHRF